ncbi:MAG TPA: NADH-quinone oxidoreductase subunit L [Candidatus Margulisbacteria bacterium]|nr:MAG: NADH dehydrogenase [Candidatus Margulisbacteria bacterium GWD2_39_127]OGI03847.1 MAG: NADH dehydrogenase [Candidatus Margulisbacteria bacterium GWF2_38_17]OGI06406.1 MAG: NADH dehydrogenase [Candidatus Margulisbacteria bacterium GWE2_39_32]HAR63537.1 NADH-quinone oxidoreductase subunit L [Candidatus Margulisiibacteriota bacterium]HCT86174.1 NADH-quinone oxidoreductase subunit L [Candidatus Margulisiibacteriota bacterium]
MNLLLFLIIFPFLTATLLLLVSNDKLRSIIVKVAAAAISAASIYLLYINFAHDAIFFKLESHLITNAMLAIEIVLAIYVFYVGIKHKKYLISLLIALQCLIISYFELTTGHLINPEHNLFVDKFSIIMALIIGIIGSLICVYALGYMKDLHSHDKSELQDRSRFFFFVLFLFLSAMFGIVFSNNLIWLYFFWEITTLCSFLLIGYKKTDISIENSLRALVMNLLGGLAFAIAIVYLYFSTGVVELDKMLALGSIVVIVPAVLISFAGITKSAQMPFSSWLVGAMVAPTPVSALLHSSTMVKAGVYIMLKLAPLMMGTWAGYMVALVGGTTFLLASLMAISVSNAKKVLAYSTIANLGLIVVCAGIGTYEAVWAGILLVIFHAIAKCLLFLCVGVVEQKIGSKNIENMDGLIISMPKVAIMMLIGMAGMFVAPFGMLISKWAVLKALIDVSPVLAALVVFGSAATMVFWVKWMGKLISVVNIREVIENTISKEEWLALYVLAFFTIAVCAVFPFLSMILIEPYVISVYGQTTSMGGGNLIIMSIMLVLVMLFPFSFLAYTKKVKLVDTNMNGANITPNTQFLGSLGQVQEIHLGNYYLESFFGEAKLSKIAVILTSIFLVIMFGITLI